MTKQYFWLSGLVLLLGLFPALFLLVLQGILLIVLVGLVVSRRHLRQIRLGCFLFWRYAVFAQFFVFFLINAAFYPVWESVREDYKSVALESWSLSLLCLVALACWLCLQKPMEIKQALIEWLPVGLMLSFLIATVVYFTGSQGWRVELFTPNPLVPPFWFLVLTMCSFAWFFEMDRRNQLLRLILFFLAGVMVVYGSARLVMLAWFLCGVFLTIWFYAQTRQEHRLRILLGMALSVIACAAAVMFVDSLSGGLLMRRMIVLFQMSYTYENVAAQFARPRIWVAAISIFSENPLMGVGQVNERIALQQKLDWELWYHAHQTYLSYLIAGGIPALISGLLMQSAVLAFFTSVKRSTLFPVFLGLGVVVTMNCLTDSIFQSAVNVQMFMATTLIFLRASDEDQPTLAPKKQVSPAIT